MPCFVYIVKYSMWHSDNAIHINLMSPNSFGEFYVPLLQIITFIWNANTGANLHVLTGVTNFKLSSKTPMNLKALKDVSWKKI